MPRTGNASSSEQRRHVPASADNPQPSLHGKQRPEAVEREFGPSRRVDWGQNRLSVGAGSGKQRAAAPTRAHLLADGIQRLLRDYREPARGRPARRAAGRPTALPRRVVERIRLELRARPRSLRDRPCAHGQGCSDGTRWSEVVAVDGAQRSRSLCAQVTSCDCRNSRTSALKRSAASMLL
jgi:hypothetical protein